MSYSLEHVNIYMCLNKNDNHDLSMYLRDAVEIQPLARRHTHLSNNIHPFDDLPKHNMLSVEITGFGSGDKELAAVSIGPSIRHGKYTRLAVSKPEVLVFESGAIDGFTASAVMISEITTLAHEIRYDPVEAASLVTKAFLSGTESAEILHRLGNNVSPQLENRIMADECSSSRCSCFSHIQLSIA